MWLVIIAGGGHHPRSLVRSQSEGLGLPARSGGVTVWLNVTHALAGELH